MGNLSRLFAANISNSRDLLGAKLVMVFLGRPAAAPDHLLLRNSLLLRLAHQLLHCPTALLGNLDTVNLEGGGTLLSGHLVTFLAF